MGLAELARRGLLLPERLPTVAPLVVRALEYDVRRGPCRWVGGCTWIGRLQCGGCPWVRLHITWPVVRQDISCVDPGCRTTPHMAAAWVRTCAMPRPTSAGPLPAPTLQKPWARQVGGQPCTAAWLGCAMHPCTAKFTSPSPSAPPGHLHGPAVPASPHGPPLAVVTLAPALITTACYDREVNCRRAAAAAFQVPAYPPWGALCSLEYRASLLASSLTTCARTQAVAVFCQPCANVVLPTSAPICQCNRPPLHRRSAWAGWAASPTASRF